MAGRHPIIAFLAGLPQFEAIALQDGVIELRSGCIVGPRASADNATQQRFQLDLQWPGASAPRPYPVDAYKYVALQIQEAAKLGFDMKLMSESAERAMLDANEWQPES